MANEQDLKKLFGELDEILNGADLSDVTPESSGFESVPDGYYLCEIEKAELKVSKSSNKPMAAIQFKIVDDGNDVEIKENGDVVLKPIKKTSGRKLFINWVLKDESSVKRFATDMLKFEGETAGESLLPKEAFTSSDTICDALDLLQSMSMRVFVHVSTTEKDDGTKSTWNNLISFKRAAMLELIKD